VVTAFAKGSPARLITLEVHELKSIWKKARFDKSETSR
jgi:hypothetical protein